MKSLLLIFVSLICLSCNYSFGFPVNTGPGEAAYLKIHPNNSMVYQNDQQKMRAIISGDDHNPPLFLIHGSPGTWGTWLHLLEDEKLQKQFQIIVVDRPGFGQSGRMVELSIDKQAEDVMAAIKFNHSGKKAIVVGYSYGGAIASKITLNYPAEVSAMLLVSGTLSAEYEKEEWYDYPAQWDILRPFLPHDFVVSVDESVALPSQLKAIEPLWAQVQIPVSVIQGLADNVVNPKTADFAEKIFVNARPLTIERVPGIDHKVPFDHSDLIIKQIWKLVEMTK